MNTTRAELGAAPRRAPWRLLGRLVPAIILVSACGPVSGGPNLADASGGAATGSITLYTSVQQPVVDALVGAFAEVEPDITVELFRAPTGELSARVAAELREGRVHGDVLWLTDPLSIEAWAQQGVLRAWTPQAAAALDPAERAASFWGTRRLNVVMVRAAGAAPGLADWSDLADPALADAVALPDPGFAGSALGALGYFALAPDYGMAYYERLAANGAVQVRSPDDVTIGVAEGRFTAGLTLDSSVRSAIDKGSPVELVWPASGAISMYGPVGLVDDTDNTPAATAFIEFLLGADGQRALGDAAQEPVLAGSGGPEPGGAQVRPDWPSVFGRQDELLEQYRTLFGG